MTREEIKILNSGGIVPSRPVHCPVLPNAFTPSAVNFFNEGVPYQPTAMDFNNVPLVDVEYLHDTRSMDSLHRTDTLAESYKRGENLKSLAKNLGKDKFKNIYSTLKN